MTLASAGPINWFELAPTAGVRKRQWEEAIWDTLADEFEGFKPADVGNLTVKVMQKLADLYLAWKEFPNRCVSKGNAYYDLIEKTLHNKFDSSMDLVKREVARLRRQRTMFAPDKRVSVDDRDKEIKALKDSIQAYKQDVELKQQELTQLKTEIKMMNYDHTEQLTPLGSPRKQDWYKLHMELDGMRQEKKRRQKAYDKKQEEDAKHDSRCALIWKQIENLNPNAK